MTFAFCRLAPHRWRAAGVAALAAFVPAFAAADDQEKAWIAPSLAHLQRMPRDPHAEQTGQATPPVIRAYAEFADPSGKVSAFMPGGSVLTSRSAFFADLGA